VHDKDDEPLDPDKVKGYVDHFGYTFPVAIAVVDSCVQALLAEPSPR
jgi:hypothetical protein